MNTDFAIPLALRGAAQELDWWQQRLRELGYRHHQLGRTPRPWLVTSFEARNGFGYSLYGGGTGIRTVVEATPENRELIEALATQRLTGEWVEGEWLRVDFDTEDWWLVRFWKQEDRRAWYREAYKDGELFHIDDWLSARNSIRRATKEELLELFKAKQERVKGEGVGIRLGYTILREFPGSIDALPEEQRREKQECCGYHFEAGSDLDDRWQAARYPEFFAPVSTHERVLTLHGIKVRVSARQVVIQGVTIPTEKLETLYQTISEWSWFPVSGPAVKINGTLLWQKELEQIVQACKSLRHG